MESEPDDRDPDLSALREGIALFNRGEFFDAHEVLEHAWRRLAGADREVYQGIIQVATGFHHASRERWHSAAILIRRGLGRLRAHAAAWPHLPLGSFVPSVEAHLLVLDACDHGEAVFDSRSIPRLPGVR